MARSFVISVILILGAISYCGQSCAKDINFEASVDSNIISIGESARLALTFYGTQDISVPELNNIDGFEARYIGPSKVMSIVNGRVSNSVTHNYTLLPLKTGDFELGPLRFDYRGDTYISNNIRIKVIEGPREKGEGPLGTASRPDLSSRIFLTMSLGKTGAYINEPIPVTIKLYINKLAARDIQFPVFSQEGFSKADFEEPKQYREALGGLVYDCIEFDTRIFGTKVGGFKVGPAEVTCSLVLRRSGKRARTPFEEDFFGGGFDESYFDDFFSHYERYPMTLKSKESAVDIAALPSEGAPGGFSGSIGDFQFVLGVSQKDVRAGDPITLKMSIYGNGNFNTISAPKLEDAKGFKVYDPQVKTEDNHRVFEQVIIPESEDILEIPKINFSFFNPRTGRYETISRGPMPITVQKAPEAHERPKIVELPHRAARGAGLERREPLGRDIIYIKDSIGRLKKGGPLYKNKGFLIIQLVPLLALLAVFITRRRAERLTKDVRYARLLRAPKAARRGIKKARRCLREEKPADFYDTIFTTLRSYLGDRFHLPTGGITRNIIDETLKAMRLDEEALKKLRELFDECDLARYASSRMSRERMNNSMANLESVISYFERAKL